MEYLHPAGGMVGGRHSPRAKPRAERRRPADRVFDSVKPVKQQIEADMVGQGRIRRFETVPHRELPSDPASRRGRLVYRWPVLPFAAGWPESPQNPVGLAIAGLGPPRSRFETDSEPTGQDIGCLVMGASKSSRTLGVSG